MTLRAKIADWLDAADIRVARIAKAEGVEDLDAYAKGCLCIDDLAYEVGYRDALAYVLHLIPEPSKGRVRR